MTDEGGGDYARRRLLGRGAIESGAPGGGGGAAGLTHCRWVLANEETA